MASFKIAAPNELAQKWWNRIRYTKEAYREFHEKAERNVNYYLGQHFEDSDRDKTGLVPRNFIASVVDTQIPATYSRNPRVMTRPKILSETDMEMNRTKRAYSRMAQGLLNKTLEEIDFKETCKLVLKDAYLMSRGIIKVGYDAQVGRKDGKEYVFSGKGPAGVPMDANMDDAYIVKERVWAERIDPCRFFYDPEVRQLKKSAWCFQEIIKPVSHVRNNPIYKNAKKIRPSDTVKDGYLKAVLEGDRDMYDLDDMPEDMQRIKFYECWDKEERMVYVLAENNIEQGFLREDGWPYRGLEAFPYKEVMPITAPSSQWGVAEVDRIIEGQDEYNIVRDQMFKHVTRALAGWVCQPNTFASPEEKRKWKSGEIMELIEVADITTLKTLMPPQMPTDYIVYLKELKEDMDEMSKQPSWRRAGQRIGARSATEVAEISQGLDVTFNEKADIVQDLIQDVVKGLWQIMQEKYKITHVVPVVGMAGLEWKKFSPSEAKEELDISIAHYSATPVSPDTERAQYMQMLPLLAQAQTAGVPVNLLAYIQKIAEKFQIYDWDEFLGPDAVQMAGGDPMVQAALSQSMGDQPQQGNTVLGGAGGASLAPRNLMGGAGAPKPNING